VHKQVGPLKHLLGSNAFPSQKKELGAIALTNHVCAGDRSYSNVRADVNAMSPCENDCLIDRANFSAQCHGVALTGMARNYYLAQPRSHGARFSRLRRRFASVSSMNSSAVGSQRSVRRNW
jgi:hypothetical protein